MLCCPDTRGAHPRTSCDARSLARTTNSNDPITDAGGITAHLQSYRATETTIDYACTLTAEALVRARARTASELKKAKVCEVCHEGGRACFFTGLPAESRPSPANGWCQAVRPVDEEPAERGRLAAAPPDLGPVVLPEAAAAAWVRPAFHSGSNGLTDSLVLCGP